MTPPTSDTLLCPQNDREKALKAMEMTWNNMEKKEKLMWIKKAAEDQKRYEVGKGLLVSSVGQDGAGATSPHLKTQEHPLRWVAFLTVWELEPEVPAWVV